MEAYYEIGVEFAMENIDFEDDHTYRQRYREKLAKWNRHTPLLPDKRLWTGMED